MSTEESSSYHAHMQYLLQSDTIKLNITKNQQNQISLQQTPVHQAIPLWPPKTDNYCSISCYDASR